MLDWSCGLEGVEAGLVLGDLDWDWEVGEGEASCRGAGGRAAAPKLQSELSLLKKRVIGGAQPELLV